MKYGVIVAEDEILIQQNIIKKIENSGAGFTVVGNAQTGIQALDLINSCNPYLLVTDIRMPVMDGLEATRTIRAMEREDAKTIPIFAVTANAFSDDIAASRASGMNEHLSKPLKFEELNAMICKYVKR